MNQDQTPATPAPDFGWAYPATGRKSARTKVHFFHGNTRFTPSLCRQASYLGQDMVYTKDSTKCPQCLAAGTQLGVFV